MNKLRIDNKLVSIRDVELALLEKGQRSTRYRLGEIWELNFDEIREALETLSQSKEGKEVNNTYIPDNIQNLIDRLLHVNSITGVESIVDMCRDAASYISNMEAYRHDMYCHTEAIKHQLDRIIK